MLDQWAEYHRVLSERNGSLRLAWAKGRPAQAQAEHMFLFGAEVYLNKAADCIADWAAEEAQLGEDLVSLILRAGELAVQVLKRILAVQREVLFSSERERKGLREPRRFRGVVSSLSERVCRLRDAGHDPLVRRACIKCKQ
eukprot:8142123-Pyramimonas_sp.AAC.1